MGTSNSSSVSRHNAKIATARTVQNSTITLQLIQPRAVLAAMMVLQLLWLTAIWITGASSNVRGLILLGVYSLVVGIATIIVPASFSDRIGQALQPFKQNRKLLVIVFLLGVFLLGVVYARHQRIWEWDEENNLVAARMIAVDGVDTFLQNYAEIPWLGNQHPPLVPLINGLAMRVFGTDLLVIRLVSLAFAIGTLLVTYLLGRELYDDGIGILAMVLLLSFPLILRLGTAALLDMQATFFFTLSLLLVLLLLRLPSPWLAVALGFSIGAGLLSKYTMAPIYLVLLGLFVADRRFRRHKLRLTVAILISGVLLVVWFLQANQAGVFSEQQVQTVGMGKNPGWFVRTGEGLKFLANSVFTKLTSAIGPYNLPLLLLGFLYTIRRRNQSDVFILLSLLMVVVFLFATIPGHRYFMLIFPALAIMIAAWLKSRPKAANRVVLLALLYAAGAWWFFIDWSREAQLFVS